LSKSGDKWAFLGLMRHHVFSPFGFISHNIIVTFFCEIQRKDKK